MLVAGNAYSASQGTLIVPWLGIPLAVMAVLVWIFSDGAYVYIVSVTLENAFTKVYKGNVHLR